MKKLFYAVFLIHPILAIAQFEIKGTVQDELGEPLAFVSVILQDSEDSSQIF